MTLGSGGGFRFTLTLPTNGTADGAHTVKFVATSSTGVTSAPVGYSFILDTLSHRSSRLPLLPRT